MAREFVRTGGRPGKTKKPSYGLRRHSEKRAQQLRQWAEIKKRKLDRQKRVQGYTWCQKCKKRTTRLELDHIKPAGKGGDWTEDNAQLLCCGFGSCHEEKHGIPWPKPKLS
jgi:hypothetical protein